MSRRSILGIGGRFGVALGGVLTALALVIAAGSAISDTLDDVQESGTIRVGTALVGIKPALWEEDGEYKGIEKEIMDYVAAELGVDYEWVITEWQTLVPGLKSNRWDVIHSGFVKTQERIQGGGILMTRPNYLVYDYVIVLQDSPIQGLEDLKGKTVASTVGTTDSLTAHSLKDQGLIGEVRDFNTYGEPFAALRNGQVDAVLLDQLNYLGQLTEAGDVKKVGDPIYYIPKPEWADAEAAADYRLGGVAMALRQEDERLLEAINAALEKMDKDGTRERILATHGLWEEFQESENLLK
jgi:ABC-type amino acid transport substrate-binding protein